MQCMPNLRAPNWRNTRGRHGSHFQFGKKTRPARLTSTHAPYRAVLQKSETPHACHRRDIRHELLVYLDATWTRGPEMDQFGELFGRTNGFAISAWSRFCSV